MLCSTSHKQTSGHHVEQMKQQASDWPKLKWLGYVIEVVPWSCKQSTVGQENVMWVTEVEQFKWLKQMDGKVQ